MNEDSTNDQRSESPSRVSSRVESAGFEYSRDDESVADETITDETITDESFIESMVVYDEEEECPYLPGRMARMPLRFPMINLDSFDTTRLLEAGFRRSGRFLYQTQCAGCNACEAIRVDVRSFVPNRSQRRALKKGNSIFELEIGIPGCDLERVDLFNKHRNLRGLNRHGEDVDEDEYRMFLVESCLDSFEMTYYYDDKLAGVAICDNGHNSASAVYTYFDPDLSRYSLGTYSIMKQIEYCQKREIDYLYLGYFVAGSPHMKYKQNFKPHQRLQQGEWKDF